MRQKLLYRFIAVAILSILFTALLSAVIFYMNADKTVKAELKDEALYIAYVLNTGEDPEKLSALDLFTGKTVIRILNEDGSSIVYGKDIIDKQKIVEMLGSEKFVEPSIYRFRDYSQYCIMRLNNGNILLLESDQHSLFSYFVWILPLLCASIAPIVLFCGSLAKKTAKTLAEPINNIDFENSTALHYEELRPLMNNISDQKRAIELKTREWIEKQEEFATVAKSMKEGLIVLSKNDCIAYINPYAEDIFGHPVHIGAHYLTLTTIDTIKEAVRAIHAKGSFEKEFSLNGKIYQVIAHSIIESDLFVGTVLLIIDITMRADAERLRREFTGNVSHELKTPLTSILGYADTIKNGWVKTEDIPMFASRICDETNRLITLIDDILRLSRLDEGAVEMQKEELSLLECCRYTANLLASKADNRQIGIRICGDNGMILASKPVLNEIIYNLCDNAIKYNRPGGSVSVEVRETEDKAILSVSDTGIGIPSGEEEKVFERFYRVDKSHSRETGGTGLGLSIVKRGSLLHDAEIELKSEFGKGTQIRILFPKNKRLKYDH
ncbi:MAG: hypothetical protein J6D00_10395 [Christensenellaceae bacterium]|nr:hypothetical protein [Christensenellaceae bacterium]